jgi:hypothetical protein
MLLVTLRNALQQAADPLMAPAMQAYMKSAMPYHGVPTPLLRQVCKEAFAEVPFATASHWQTQVLDLWRGARFFETFAVECKHLFGENRRCEIEWSCNESLRNCRYS